MAEVENDHEYPKYVWPKDVSKVPPIPGSPNNHAMVIVNSAEEELEVAGEPVEEEKPAKKKKGW